MVENLATRHLDDHGRSRPAGTGPRTRSSARALCPRHAHDTRSRPLTASSRPWAQHTPSLVTGPTPQVPQYPCARPLFPNARSHPSSVSTVRRMTARRFTLITASATAVLAGCTSHVASDPAPPGTGVSTPREADVAIRLPKRVASPPMDCAPVTRPWSLPCSACRPSGTPRRHRTSPVPTPWRPPPTEGEEGYVLAGLLRHPPGRRPGSQHHLREPAPAGQPGLRGLRSGGQGSLAPPDRGRHTPLSRRPLRDEPRAAHEVLRRHARGVKPRERATTTIPASTRHGAHCRAAAAGTPSTGRPRHAVARIQACDNGLYHRKVPLLAGGD